MCGEAPKLEPERRPKAKTGIARRRNFIGFWTPDLGEIRLWFGRGPREFQTDRGIFRTYE